MRDKRGKILRKILIGIGIGIMAIAGLFFVIAILFLTGGPPKVTRDVSKYEETMRKYTSEVVGTVQTGFFTFPNPIPDSAFENGAEPTFYFSYQDTWDDPTCEVYLKCTYSDEDYASELNRLKNDTYTLEDEDRKTITQLEYEESGRFIRPVYKAIDSDDYSYEYAMEMYGNLEGENFYRQRDLYHHYQKRYIQDHGLDLYDVTDERQYGSRRY